MTAAAARLGLDGAQEAAADPAPAIVRARVRNHLELVRAHAEVRAANSELQSSLAERDALMVDAEPERLAVELVNRYRAVKRAGLL